MPCPQRAFGGLKRHFCRSETAVPRGSCAHFAKCVFKLKTQCLRMADTQMDRLHEEIDSTNSYGKAKIALPFCIVFTI